MSTQNITGLVPQERRHVITFQDYKAVFTHNSNLIVVSLYFWLQKLEQGPIFVLIKDKDSVR